MPAAGSGGSGLSGLLSPGGAGAGATAGRHRLATEGTSGSPASAGGGSGRGSGSGRALSSAALTRLFSSPTSEADLFSALQVREGFWMLIFWGWERCKGSSGMHWNSTCRAWLPGLCCASTEW